MAAWRPQVGRGEKGEGKVRSASYSGEPYIGRMMEGPRGTYIRSSKLVFQVIV